MIQAGFNHNIRHKNVLFHVQTEDYGRQKHMVVTQLFYQGTIVAKSQTDYQEFLDLEDIAEQIDEVMKVQHIKMLKDLVAGKVPIPDWIFQKESMETENSKPVLDLDKEAKKDKKIEQSVAEFLEKK
ncbi:MAG: hypothetical protein IT286_01440 [Proteobacteria bacterium]|jgi:hypothetical protein|nr:hypothetical protein [Pseudomonadota bacterium]